MFINLTRATGRILMNIEHIVGIVEHEGKVIIVARIGEPVEVFETYDDIIKRIEDSRGSVW
jgi:hypothetical protein